MVVFTCTHCGDSLQKPKVEKHYQTVCRTLKSLTCVDCLKDFKGEEYAIHTKCVTEDERYAAKGANNKPVIKKGEIKQESWTELITNVINKTGNIAGSQKRVLDIMASSTNVPRKKNKFINFIKSSSGGRVKNEDVEAVWSLIEQYKATQNGTETANNVVTVSQPEDADQNKTKKKRKLDVPPTISGTNGDTTLKKKKHKSAAIGENADITSEKVENLTTDNEAHRDSQVSKKKKRKLKVDSTLDSANKPKHKKADVPMEEVTNGNGEVQNTEEVSAYTSITFSYEQQILKVLNSKDSITLEKLQKKVLSAYTKKTGNQVSSKNIKKFNKKLKKMTEVEIKDENVRLINKS